MRILVIGGTGFIGPHGVRSLTEMGHEVTLFHRGLAKPNQALAVREVLGERRHLSDFADEWKRLAPEVVLDMIPVTEQDARVLMSTFKGTACRLVVISSADVYRAYGRLHGTEPGPPDPLPLTEDAPLRERLYPYRGETPRREDDPKRWMDDYDKILVEQVVMGDPELPGTILRLAAVHGPGDPLHRLFFFLKRMADNRPASLLDALEAKWRWARAYVENVAAAITLAVTDGRAAGRIFNVAEPEGPSRCEWVKSIARSARWTGRIVLVPEGRLPLQLQLGVKDPKQDLVLDTSRIRRELGYKEIVSPDEGLSQTVAWEREHPPENVDPQMFDYSTEDAILAKLELQRQT